MYRFRFILALVAAMAIAVVACRDKAVTTLNDIVTDTVIEVAVASLAQDIKAGDAGNWSYADSYGPTWTANTKARHAIFADHLGEDWFDLVYDNKTDYRERAMRIARESLDTPEELWAAYLRHKAKVIAEIRKHGIQDDVVRYSTAALPYFSPPGGEELTDPHGDHGAKEWAERRRTEGGDALVVAWGEVIADLASSL